MRAFVALIILISSFSVSLRGQDCKDLSGFQVSNSGQVKWDLFPEFQLPFPVIYGGKVHNENANGPLKHGFSHIGDPGFISKVPIENRAMIYYGMAYPFANQPWETERSPWGNNLDLYHQKWQQDYFSYANTLGNSNLIESDLFVYDIERVWRFDHEISLFSSNDIVPDDFKSLSNEEFLKRYKMDMRDLYSTGSKSFLSNGKALQTKIGSYADTPIVNTFQNIQGRSWTEWSTNNEVLNFITSDNDGNVGGAFYDDLDILTPSAYYYYDYPHQFAGEYLSYLLFQIEANKAWTDKPVIPFVWLRYSANENVKDQFIRPWMAEATAIFPFFSGADGLWLWENPTLFNATRNFNSYEYFNKGLYRLSEFKDFFVGDFELIMETPARDYNESKEPIWRGVVKDDEILIAAHNPFAENENEEVSLGVSYGNWSGIVNLKGYEVFLCKFDMSVLSLKEADEFVKVYPNPVGKELKIELYSQDESDLQIDFLNTRGQVLNTSIRKLEVGKNQFTLDVSDVSESRFYLHLRYGEKFLTKKILRFE